MFIYTFISGKKYAEILPTLSMMSLTGYMASYFPLHLCFQNLMDSFYNQRKKTIRKNKIRNGLPGFSIVKITLLIN